MPGNIFDRRNSLEFSARTGFSLDQIIMRLQIHPELRRVAENRPRRKAVSAVMPRSPRTISFNRARDIFMAAAAAPTDRPYSSRNSSFQKNPGGNKVNALAAGYAGKIHAPGVEVFTFDRHAVLLVIIDQFDVESIAMLETKADAPLVIDANAPIPFVIARQRFKPVTGRIAQIAGCCGGINGQQFFMRPPDQIAVNTFQRQTGEQPPFACPRKS